MLRTKTLEVSGTGSIEATSEILVGTAEEPKHVTRLFAYETTTALNNDAVVRAYREQVRIVDFDIRVFFDQAATPLLTRPIEIPLDLDLAAGQALDVGHVSGTTASDMVFVVEYEVGGARR